MTEARTAPVPDAAKGEPAIDGLWLYAVLALLATAGFFYINIMSAIVDGLVTGLGFSNPQAGYVASANVYGASVGALAAVFVVRRVHWKPTLTLLFSLLLLLDLASTALRDPTALVLLRAVHGFVGGMSVGVTYSVMARTRSADRAFGVLLLVQFGLGGLGVMWLPRLVPLYGARILFLALATLTLAALVATLLLPRAGLGGPRGARRAARVRGTGRLVALTLAALFLFQAGNMGLGAFIIGLGEHAGLGRDFISSTLGGATWIGALGALAVVAIGLRYGRTRPLALASLFTLVGTAAFYASASGTVYFAANIGTAITWSFVVPLLFGMAARLDPSGELATLAGFFSKLGLASGPLLGGLLLGSGDYRVLIGASLAAIALALLLALVAAARIDALGVEAPAVAAEAGSAA